VDGRTSIAASRKNHRKRILRLMLCLIVALIVCGTIWQAIAQQVILNNYDRLMDDLNAQYETEEKIAEQIKSTAELYATDEYIEHLARERGYVRYNERVFIDNSIK